MVDIRQSLFQHLAMPGIMAGLKLLQHVLARKKQTVFTMQCRHCFGAQRCFARQRDLGRSFHLCFDGLAFPPAGHDSHCTRSLKRLSTPKNSSKLGCGVNSSLATLRCKMALPETLRYTQTLVSQF